MSTISNIHAREVLDSRGNPTVEAEVTLADGTKGRAIVPSGASTGEHEAVELRDGDKQRFLGKGVLKAVENVNSKIAKELCRDGRRRSARARPEDDRARRHREQRPSRRQRDSGGLDGSGAGGRQQLRAAALPVSGRRGRELLPVPMMNILNGGAHADNNVDFQEFMVMPVGAKSFSEALRWGVEVFHTLKRRAQEARLQHRGRRRRRLRALGQIECRGDRSGAGGHSAGRIQAGRADCDRARSRCQRVLPGWQIRLQEVRQVGEEFGRDGPLLGEVGERLSHRLAGRWFVGRAIGRAGGT